MAPMIDGTYGEGITLTSPIKAFGPALEQILRELDNGRFQGGDLILGIGSADPSKSFIQLAPSTRFGAGFTRNDYASLIRELYNGTRRVSSNIAVSVSDLVSAIQVIDLGNLK
jgi:basic membrane protein A